MKKSILQFLLLGTYILGTITISAQTTDRFVRIVGNSSYEFTADKANLYFSIKGVGYGADKSSTEVNYSNFVDTLSKLGIPEDRIELNLGTYNSKYKITANLEEAEKLQSIKLPGVNLTNRTFSFSNTNSMEISENLTIEAIDDAKRKASSICNNINMKLGKILNIEDTSSDCCGAIKDSKDNITTKTRSINVTFEIKDK